MKTVNEVYYSTFCDANGAEMPSNCDIFCFTKRQKVITLSLMLSSGPICVFCICITMRKMFLPWFSSNCWGMESMSKDAWCFCYLPISDEIMLCGFYVTSAGHQHTG